MTRVLTLHSHQMTPGRWWMLAFVTALLLQSTISFYFLWILPSGDEAVHIYNAYRVANAEWPYRDFFSYITPVTYLLGGVVLSLVAEKVIVLRLTMAFFALGGIFLMYRIIEAVVAGLRERIIWLTVYVSVTVMASTYFSHHNVDQFLFVLILYLLICHHEKRAYFAFLGLVVGIDSLVHQAHGFYYFVAIIAYIFFMSGFEPAKKLRTAFEFAAPILALYTVFFVVLLGGGVLGSFYQDAILWVLTTYKQEFAFGPFDDTLFFLQSGEYTSEQFLFLGSKVAIILAVIFIFVGLVTGKFSSMSGGQNRLPGLVIVAGIAGGLQTLHNFSSYYFLFFCAFGMQLMRPQTRWMPYILLLLTLVQTSRVLSFPVRYFDEYAQIRGGMVEISGNYFYSSDEAEAMRHLAELLRDRGIRQAIVVGRSPEIYFLTGIINPTRYDVIFPVYLDSAQLSNVVAKLGSNTVIYDRTIEKIRVSSGFSDTRYYKKTPARLEAIENSDLFKAFKHRNKIIETPYFEVFG